MAARTSRFVPILLTALVAFGPASTDIYLPALPMLGRAFGADPAEVQLTLSVFLAGFAVSQLVYGPLSDRFGRRPVILAGLAIFLAASVGCAVAPSIEALIACRFVQAVGACSGPVLGRAVVRDIYGRDGAARMLAYIAMAMALAPAAGPVLGGYLSAWFGWRANFWLLAGFGAAVLAGVAAVLGETNRHRDPLATRPRRLAANYAALARHRTYVGHVLVVAFTYSGIFSFISGSSFVLIDGLGLSPQSYGMCFATMAIGYMIGSFAAGRLSARLGMERMIALGTGLSAAAGLVMAALAAGGVATVAAVVAPFAAYMIGAGLTLPNAFAGAVGPFPAMAGLTSALMGFVQMTMAAVVGIGIGHLTDGSGGPMAFAVLLVAIAAGLAFLTLVRSRPAAAPQGGSA